jgi:hypothetical protein
MLTAKKRTAYGGQHLNCARQSAFAKIMDAARNNAAFFIAKN